MGRKYRVWRWIVSIGGCAILMQASTCTTTSGSELTQQVVVPQIANIVSDLAFFILDNVLVHLTT